MMLRIGISVFCALSLLLMIGALLVPFSPKMPTHGLDPSWALALNEAVSQGLAFGTDLVFTLGPYSSIYTKFYHPATDNMMLWGSIYLAISYWFALLLLIYRGTWPKWIALAVFLLAFVYAKDALLYSYPLLLGLVIIKNQPKQSISCTTQTLIILSVLCMPLGLLPLIKGSFLLLCVAVILWSIFMLCMQKHYRAGFVVLCAPLLALCFFWCVAGQHMDALWHYLTRSVRIAFSFTEAMSVEGDHDEVLAYLFTSFALLALIYNKTSSKQAMMYLGSLFFLFLWLSFKAGFVRHFGHALIPATSIMIAALMLPYVLNTRWTIGTLMLAIATSLYIEGHYTHINPLKNIQSTYTAAWYGMTHRMFEAQQLKRDFDLSLLFLRARHDLPVVPGGSDVYSYDQSDLIASTNRWAPRPVFQSYSVFDTYLADLNRDHLLSAHAADTIFFKIQAIDKRLPSLEDGASWPVLLQHYQAKGWVHDFLLLEKMKQPPFIQMKELVHQSALLNQWIVLPKTDNQLIFATMDVQPTLWGRIRRFFYKPQELMIAVHFNDGSQKYYRFIAAMAGSSFLLSPCVENTSEFFSLYHHKRDSRIKKIVSFAVVSEQKKIVLSDWNSHYDVRLNALITPLS